MRKRRWRLCVLSLTTLLSVAGFAWLVVRSGPRISPASYAQIQLGMTNAEVEAIIAVPPGDYSAGGIRFMDTDTEPPDPVWEAFKAGARCVKIYGCVKVLDESHFAVWTGHAHEIAVEFDASYHVTRKTLREYYDGPPWWTRLLRLVGIQ